MVETPGIQTSSDLVKFHLEWYTFHLVPIRQVKTMKTSWAGTQRASVQCRFLLSTWTQRKSLTMSTANLYIGCVIPLPAKNSIVAVTTKKPSVGSTSLITSSKNLIAASWTWVLMYRVVIHRSNCIWILPTMLKLTKPS